MLSSEMRFTNIMTKCPNSFVQDCRASHTHKYTHTNIHTHTCQLDCIGYLPALFKEQKKGIHCQVEKQTEKAISFSSSVWSLTINY